MSDWDSLVEDIDEATFDCFSEMVTVNGGQPVPVIWDDQLLDFDAMSGTCPVLYFKGHQQTPIRKGDSIVRVKTGGKFTVSDRPIREDGLLVVKL